MKVSFELTGTTPLLMHRDDVEASDLVKQWIADPANKNVSVKGDDRSPPWTWQTYSYHDGEHLVIPSQNLMVALRQAGAQLILKRQKTFKEITQSGLLVPVELMEFRNNGDQVAISDVVAMRESSFEAQAKEVLGLGFRLFVIRARVGQAKHVRVRPRFENWSVHGTVEVLVPEITTDVLKRLFDLAGRVGLCDWRPGCKTPGPFGMFTAKLK